MSITFDEAYDVEFALWRDTSPGAEFTDEIDAMLCDRADSRVAADVRETREAARIDAFEGRR